MKHAISHGKADCYMIGSIIEGLLEIIIQVIFETVMFYTGEVVLFLITFGCKKPRWDFYSDKKPTVWAVMTESSALVGLVFWIVTIAWATRTFF